MTKFSPLRSVTQSAEKSGGTLVVPEKNFVIHRHFGYIIAPPDRAFSDDVSWHCHTTTGRKFSSPTAAEVTKMDLIHRLKVITRISLLVFVSVLTASSAGETDLTFGAALINVPTGRAFTSFIQPDGKIITQGTFRAFNGRPSPNLIRLNSDGSTDTSFTGHFVDYDSVRSIGLQSDGKIIIAGVFVLFDSSGNVVRGIARLNTDGTIDPTFVGDPSIPSILWDLHDMEVLADNTILVAGGNGFARLMPDGSVDSSFSDQNRFVGVRQFALEADGKIINSGGLNIRRYNPDGTTDASFPTSTFSSSVSDIKIQTDGKILVGGQFTHVNGFVMPQLARFNTNGTVDSTFVNTFHPTFGAVQEIIPLADGKILVIGGHNTVQSDRTVIRLNADGAVDVSFLAPITEAGWDLDVQADGKIIVSSGGVIETINDSGPNRLLRLSTDGSLDNTFQANIGGAGWGYKIFVQPDGKILVGGRFNFGNNLQRTGIVRFNADGTADPSFNALLSGPGVTAIDVQLDGKVIINGSGDARRLNADGSLDVIFSGSSLATDVKVLADGKVLISGADYLKRYNSNGTQDVSFAPAINDLVAKIAVQPDGKIIIVGEFTQVNSVNRGRVARLNSDGGLDTGFDTSNGASNSVLDVALQDDGKIVIVGRFLGVNLAARTRIARLNSDGSLDTSLSAGPNSDVGTVRVQPNGKILIGGLFTMISGVGQAKIGRLQSNGMFDPTFNPVVDLSTELFTERVHDIELQGDGKILLAGDFDEVNNVYAFGIARLLDTSSASMFDYDGDGRTDISVFRPSENRWYVFRSSDSVVYQPVFAINGDVPVPADYDGDGKTDVAIFRPSSGDWWYLATSDGSQRSTHWGTSGDVARPSDFDGDGKADFIVFRPSENNWYRLGSTGAFSVINFGLAGDKPLTGDFDGDGKSDVAIYRPSTGDWWWQSSIDNVQRATHWGIASDTPTPADFDGDGKTDFAVYRATTGTWYIVNSSNGQSTIVPFGISEDKPVAGDYDGDGRADIAVFRPSTGVWYLLRSTSGFAAAQFGISTDQPTPGAFVP